MSVRRSELSEDLWVIEARGRLDASGSPDLQAQLQGLLEHGQSALAVDFTRVSYISSSGLKALLIALRRARRMGGDVKLFGLRNRVREVFDLAGFDSVFQILPREADAVAAFSGQPSELPRCG